jgi:hypothetical protein
MKKHIEVNGIPFDFKASYDKEGKRFTSEVENGIYKNLNIGGRDYKITDISEHDGKQFVTYVNEGKEEAISVESLKEVNGHRIFEPSEQVKGIVSKNPFTPTNFSLDDKDKVMTSYEVVEADDVIPSHLGNGEVNPRYSIKTAQNRNRSTKQSLAQIHTIATNPKFEFLADNVTAQHGAPIVTGNYNVIAGNGRAIGVIEHYASGGTKYKEQLLENAERLGFKKEDIKKMKNPILVRKVFVDDKEAQRLGAISNQDQKLALEEDETAKGMATRIDDNTFEKIANMFNQTTKTNPDVKGIGDYLNVIGEDLVKLLTQKGIILPNEAHLYYNLENGKLNREHKEKIKGVLLQTILGDASDYFQYLSDASNEGITKSLGDLISLKNKEGDLIPDLAEAIKLQSRYQAVKEAFNGTDDYISQAVNDAFEPLKASGRTLAMFELLSSRSPNDIMNKIHDYKELLEPTMFGDGLSPDEAFKQVFGLKYPNGVGKRDDIPEEVQKSLMSKNRFLKALKSELFTGQEKDGKKLLPSEKNPLIRRWQSVEKENESEQNYRRRMAAQISEVKPKDLPEDYEKYFNIDKDTLMVKLEHLIPSKKDAKEEGKQALKYMVLAKQGIIPKRDPILVKQIEEGKYEIIDGNGTYTGAKEIGWKSLPVKIE